MPDFWQFPTGSMSIGPIPSTHQARFMRYLQHRKMLDPRDRKVTRDDYVPAGWAGNPNLYNGAIRPYCTGCHLALGPSRDLDFTTLSQVLAKKANGTLQSFLCSSRSMPHSEVAFNHFWTDDGGSWPRYVERPDTLGLRGCTTP